MSAPLAVLAATGTNAPTYIDDLFSVYLYQGNGGTQTITNGIDLAGKGGLVWTKQRSSTANHALASFPPGRDTILNTASTNAGEITGSLYDLPTGQTGYIVFNDSRVNTNTATYVSWTFRKAARFFDVVTYTGNNTAGRSISHSLGQAPGMIIIKNVLSGSTQWVVWHRGSGNAYQFLNTTAASVADNGKYWGNGSSYTAPTSTTFTVSAEATSGLDVNAALETYVAYLFAHDTTTDGLIQCGSFTTDGSGNATVTLGWEPQFVLYKTSSVGGYNWTISDSMRGLPGVSGVASAKLYPNVSDAEATSGFNMVVTATGLSITGAGASLTYIYLAIRRPNKPPTVGTQVYNAIARTGTGAAATVTGVGFAPDLVIPKARANNSNISAFDRLRGALKKLVTTATDAETTASATLTGFDVMDGFSVGADTTYDINFTVNYINWCFRRAPGVFDVVCYTGNGTASRTISHSLGVAPEMMIAKSRGAVANWWVFHKALSNNLPMTNGAIDGSFALHYGSPTATNFTLNAGANGTVNDSTTYVWYGFATKTGISYVGSYTGNGGTAGSSGSSQNLDFGFSAGARFVMIKATNATGDWFVWDSTRGIVASTDPHLSLNTTAAEVTTDDSVDPYSLGVTINQLAATDLNVTGRTYLVLSFA